MGKLIDNVRLSFWFGIRFLFVSKEKNIVHKMTFIGIVVVTISVIIPIVFFGVINGIHEGIKVKHIDRDFHVKVHKKHFYNADEVMQSVRALDVTESVIPYFEGKGILNYNDSFFGVQIRGLPKNYHTNNVDFINHFKLIKGRFDFTNPFQITIGIGLLKKIQIELSDIDENKGVWVYFISSSNPFGSCTKNKIQYKLFKIVGVYTSGYAEYDNNLIFCSLSTSKKLYGKDNYISGVGIYLVHRRHADEVRSFIRSEHRSLRFYVHTWTYNKDNLLYVLTWQKNLLWIILIIVLLISFIIIYINVNVIALDKQQDIILLKAIGYPKIVVRFIFLWAGLFIGIIGSTLGLILGTAMILSATEITRLFYEVTKIKLFSIPLLQQEFFYYRTDLYEMALITLGVIVVSLMGAYFPARKADLEKPAKIMKNVYY